MSYQEQIRILAGIIHKTQEAIKARGYRSYKDTYAAHICLYRRALTRQPLDHMRTSMKEEIRMKNDGKISTLYGILPLMTVAQMEEYREDNTIILPIHDDLDHWRTKKLILHPCPAGTVMVHVLTNEK